MLRQALASLEEQTHTNWEAIVVDNGSPRTAAAVGDPRVRRIRAPRNLGECGGRNLAFAHSRGRFVGYLDDDDLLPPDSLALRVAFLETNAGCGMVYTEYRKVRHEDRTWVEWRDERKARPWQRKEYYDALIRRVGRDHGIASYLLRQFNFVRGGTPLIRREVLDTVGPFDERLEAYGDYDMWLRIAERFTFEFLDASTYIYRIHPASTHLRAAKDGREKRDALRVCRKHGIRQSVQFASHQHDIDRLWRRSVHRP